MWAAPGGLGAEGGVDRGAFPVGVSSLVWADQKDSQLSLSPALPVVLAELAAVMAVGWANANLGALFTDFRLAVWDERVVACGRAAGFGAGA